MSSVLKGAMNYASTGTSSYSISENEKEANGDTNSSIPIKSENNEQSGYLKKAITGVSSGVYTVGSAGFNSVKWIAGSTYNVTTGVVGTAASVAGNVVRTVIKGTPKEHRD